MKMYCQNTKWMMTPLGVSSTRTSIRPCWLSNWRNWDTSTVPQQCRGNIIPDALYKIPPSSSSSIYTKYSILLLSSNIKIFRGISCQNFRSTKDHIYGCCQYDYLERVFIITHVQSTNQSTGGETRSQLNRLQTRGQSRIKMNTFQFPFDR